MLNQSINRETLENLIGLYRGLVTRNTADTGPDSPATQHAKKILDHYLDLHARHFQARPS